MLDVTDVTVRFGDTAALSGVEFSVEDGHLVAVLGPSGSGKSTLLRVIAGLQVPDSGSIRWNGVDVTNVPPHRRGFGLMFQDYALFPHRTVEGNVAFGLEMAEWSRGAVRERVSEMLDLVGLSGFEKRKVDTLSGGEQQRVALARALALRPPLLMLDEPMGALDRTLRERLVAELRDVLITVGVTVIYVTHDQEEAFTIADRIVIMEDGTVAQLGTPEEVWRQPADEFVARFLGFDAIVDAQVSGGVAATDLGPIPIGIPDGAYRVVVPPDAVEADPGSPIRATVVGSRFSGGHHLATVSVNGHQLDVAIPLRAEKGDDIGISIDPQRITTLSAE